jgi:hypothetical protein
MLQDGEGVPGLSLRRMFVIVDCTWHGRTERGLVVDVEELDPSENSFSVHQRVRVAIDRLHNTGCGACVRALARGRMCVCAC